MTFYYRFSKLLYLIIFFSYILACPILGQDGIFDPTTLKTTIDCQGGVHEGFIRVGSYDKTGFIDKTGKLVIPPIYKFDGVEFSNGLVRLRKDNKYHVFNKNGKSIIPEGYKFKTLRNGLVVAMKDNKYHILDKSGEIISPDHYDDIEFLSDSILKVKIANTYGLLDESMNTIVPVEYDDIRTYKDDLVAVSQGKKWGFINKKGKVVIPIEYQVVIVRDFFEGLTFVFKNDKPLIIDVTGKVVHTIGEKYYFQEILSKNLISVTSKDSIGNYKFGVINLQGIEIIPCKYDFINFCLPGGLASVNKNGKWGIVEKSGNIKASFEYEDISLLSKNLICLQKNGKREFMNQTGKIFIPVDKYRNVTNIPDYEDLLFISDQNENKIIDFSERIVIHNVESFFEGIAVTKKNNKYGFVDMNGKLIAPNDYNYVLPFSENLAIVVKNNTNGVQKHGFLDKNGKIVIPIEYDSAISFSEGFAPVRKGNLWGIVDTKGKFTLLFDRQKF
jgi:WG containing repeat